MSPDEHSVESERVIARGNVMERLQIATVELLDSVPPHNVTSRQIAAAAGVNVGQIHHFFGSKDNLIIAALKSNLAHAVPDASDPRPALPIEIERRSGLWPTVAYVAASDLWRHAPEEPTDMVLHLVDERATARQLPTSHPFVLADLAVVIALQDGWWTFQDLIESALAPFDADLARLRADVRDRSSRLFDDSIPLLPGAGTVCRSSDDDPDVAGGQPALGRIGAVDDDVDLIGFPDQPQGREEVRQSLLQAAVELLSTRAMSEVTTKDIASRAGVNHGQVHHYFGSKGDLVAEATQLDSLSFLEDRMDGGRVFPLPIDTECRTPLWRALAHNAMTGGWDRPGYGQTMVLQRMVEARATEVGRPTTDPDVLADAAVVHALGIGWDVFQDVIEFVLKPFTDDLLAVRERVSVISNRLVENTIDLTDGATKAERKSEAIQR